MALLARVAVIGAGVAGLAAARELHREGHRVVVLEKRHSLGGTWLYDSRVDSDPLSLDPARAVVVTSLYHSLRTNLPRQTMGFLDYPFAKRPHEDQRTFPGHEEVLWFLNEFADEFQLRELIRFCTEVVRAERAEGRNDEWVVESRSRGSESAKVVREVYDAVVVCNGHYTEPHLVEVPGIEKWSGYQIHSHNYRIPKPFTDQVVVLIGFGPSAFDISRDVATVAKEVHIATRAPNVTVGKLDNHKNIWQHEMIEFVDEDGKVVFQDGSSVHADTIFYCTGYKYHFPFIETNGIVTIDDNRVGPLYKHVFPPRLAPWLSFIGMPKQGTPFMTAELQSKWLAHVLSGKALLPTEEEMMSDIEKCYHHMEETGVPKRFTHVLPPNEIEYMNWLLAQVGMPPLKEWRGRMYRECAMLAKAKRDGYKDQWDDDYWDAVIASQIEFVYEDGKVVFQDGSSVHADTIFYCTGYKYHFPFIETNGIVTIDDDNRVGPLYKQVFPPHLAPWLSFIGMPKQDTPFLTTELQSKWLAHVLSGKVLLPTEEEMMSDVENYYHHMEETGVPKSFTHVLPPNEIEYRNWLLAQVEMPPLKEWRGRMYRECVKFAKAKLDGYRDQWDDDYWDAVIASQEVNHLANGQDVGVAEDVA